jgi:ParB family transcriptional regulator, chromosome partitioning protein
MARRDIFRHIKEAENGPLGHQPIPGYAVKGASRNMLSSIGQLAEKAAMGDRYLEGAAVVDLDTALIDASFVSDRMAEDDEAFQDLVSAIRERGQNSPVLVRPHPDQPGRYQTVFGHRRVKAARQLSRPVRAVVKPVSDVDHVIAQGQENSARENLSFIERAVFSQQLLDRGYDRATIQAALTVDAPMLTRMLSVTSRVPDSLTRAIGACKGIGRDRWLDFAQAIEKPSSRAKAEAFLGTPQFGGATPDGRFDLLLAELKRADRPVPSRGAKPSKTKWQPDKALSAELIDSGKGFAVSFKSKDASRFGRYLAANLDRLYGEFKQER